MGYHESKSPKYSSNCPNPGVILSVAKNLPKPEKQYLHFCLGRFFATLRMTPGLGQFELYFGDFDSW